MEEYIYILLLSLDLIALAVVFVYGINCYYMIFAFKRHYPHAVRRHKAIQQKFLKELPKAGWSRVTVQIPIFNEYFVIERLIESVCRLDYPRDRLEIQVLDDSTDETSDLAQTLVSCWQARGTNIVYLHRHNRDGFKAGALREGLKTAKGEFIAIFDADFVPESNFLKESIPYLCDPTIGMIQARWGHLNADYSLLTRLQAIGIDGHFIIEQVARAWAGLFLNFNGTAGVWRRKTIEDAGGWQADTLTEDLDLSYRAQLKGWKLMFSPLIVCPGEIPVTITAFKSQQYRWAKGSIQTAKKMLGPVLRSRWPLRAKIQAFLHLTHYMVHPMMLIVILSSIPMLYSPWGWARPLFFFSILWMSTFGPSSMYLLSQRSLYRNWRRRLLLLPALMCLGTGMAVNNTKAVLEALLNVKSGFVRTPKYGIRNKRDRFDFKRYRLSSSGLLTVELVMGLYSLASLGLFLRSDRFLPSPFLLVYAIGFFYVFVLSLRHRNPFPGHCARK